MAATLKEFRDFLLRGNLIELAIAFVMGLAFAALVNSFIENLVMPIIAAIVGKPDFRDLHFTIHDAVFRYGSFITDAIQFVAIAAAVFFFIVKPVQAILARRRTRDSEEDAPSDEERRHQELLAALRAR
jgi:large conductance mechanosensitive channel